MIRTRTVGLVLGALSLSLCVGMIPGEPAQQDRHGSRFLKGRLLVKYQDTLTECAHCLLKDRAKFQDATSDRSDSLDRLHAKYEVRAARAVFRSEAEDAALGQHLGRRPKLSDLRQYHRAKLAAAKQKRNEPLSESQELPVDLAPIYVLELDETLDVQAASAEYAKDPHVAYAHPDYILQASFVPNDPYYSSSNSWGQGYADLWALKPNKINAEQAWDQTQGSGIIVAVIDTGVDTGHPDLAANIQAGGSDYSTCTQVGPNDTCLVTKPRDSTPEDLHGHGTHVAGIIAAVGNNSQGIIGVAPQAKILPVKALGDVQGAGLTSDVADAIVYAADQNAKVINLSLGDCRSPQGAPATPHDIPVLTTAVNHAVIDHGVVVVASAGNGYPGVDGGINVIHCAPANLPNVVAVGASNQNDEKADFSNFGAIDVVAPGSGLEDELPQLLGWNNILSTRSRQIDPQSALHADNSVGGVLQLRDASQNPLDYLRLRGTSQAAPHVSGLAALLRAKYPSWNWQSVKTAIRLGAQNVGDPGRDIWTGYGRINALNSLNQTPRVILTSSIYAYTLESDPQNPAVPLSGSLTVRVTNEWLPANTIQGTVNLTGTSATCGEAPTTPMSGAMGTQSFGNLTQGASSDRVYSVNLSSHVPPGDCVYFNLQLTGSNFSPITVPLKATVTLDAQATWPRPASGEVISSPVVVDLHPGVTGKEVVVGSLNGQVFAFQADGANLPGWPQTPIPTVQFGTGIYSSPAVGDIDGNSDLEVVIGTAEWNSDDPFNPYAFGQVHVFHHDGTPLSGWPQFLMGTQIKSTPALGNLDTDTPLEVVVVAEDGNVYVFESNGSLKSGWPKATSPNFPKAIMPIPSPALANLDGDAALEIVVAATDGMVYAWNADGTAVTGWSEPKALNTAIESSPAIADLDGNGILEVIVGTGTNCEGDPSDAIAPKSGTIHVWQADGAPYLPMSSKTILGGCVRASPAVGNLDGDVEREIVVALYNGTVHVLNHDGSTLWSRQAFEKPKGYITASPALADLDGDGTVDVIVGTREGYVYAFRGGTGALFDGIPFKGSPIHLNNYQPDNSPAAFAIQSSPALVDLDNDGMLELVLGADDGWLYRLDLQGASSGTPPWPMFRQNPARTGALLNQPVVLVPNAVTFKEQWWPQSFTLPATNTGGQPVSYTVISALPSGASFNAATRTFSWTPSFSQAGVYPVTFRAQTPSGTQDLTTTITVLDAVILFPKRDTYVYASEPSTCFGGEQELKVKPAAAIPPVPSKLAYLMFELSGLTSVREAYLNLYATQTSSSDPWYGGDLKWVPSTTWNEIGAGCMTWSTRRPELWEIGPLTVAPNVWVQDPHDLSAYLAPGLRTSFLIAKEFHNGNFDTNEVVYKSRETANTPWLLVYTNPPANPATNRPPELAPIGNKIASEALAIFSVPLSFHLHGSDPDNDPLTFSVVGSLPPGATFTPTAFNPGPNYLKSARFDFNAVTALQQSCSLSHPVTFKVCDGRGGCDQETITITIQPHTINHAPVAKASASGDTTYMGRQANYVAPGRTIYLDGAQSCDVDGDPLWYVWSEPGNPSRAFIEYPATTFQADNTTTPGAATTAPMVSSATTLTFKLTAVDHLFQPNQASSDAYVNITVDPACLIVFTVSYGNPMAPELEVLRAYRDQILRRSRLGRSVIDLYYVLSPPVVELIRDKPLLRALVRRLITPLMTYCRGQLPSAKAEMEQPR